MIATKTAAFKSRRKHQEFEKDYLNTKQVAEIMKLHVKTIRIWCRDGRIKTIDVAPAGSRRPVYRILIADVKQFIGDRTRAPRRKKN